MNEPAQRCEEQIISLFQDRETLVCQGWILKKMGGCLLVYPLYYKYSQGNIPDNIRKCEEISRQSGLDCVFRIVEHTNYYLGSILTDNGYMLKECGVVGEWNLTEDVGNLCVDKRAQGSLCLENGTFQLIMELQGYWQIFRERKNCRNNMGGQAFAEPIFTAAIKRRRNPPKNRRIENGCTE